MDDATTAFAAACAVIAASTGMVLCLAPKNVNDAVIDEEPITKEEEKGAVVEEKEAATATEEAMKEEISQEPILKEEPVMSDDPAIDVTATTTEEAVPEQRPDDPAPNDATTSPLKKKRRFTLRGDRSNRIFEGKAQTQPNFKKSRSMKWLPFRPNNNNKKSDAVNVGQEV